MDLHPKLKAYISFPPASHVCLWLWTCESCERSNALRAVLTCWKGNNGCLGSSTCSRCHFLALVSPDLLSISCSLSHICSTSHPTVILAGRLHGVRCTGLCLDGWCAFVCWIHVHYCHGISQFVGPASSIQPDFWFSWDPRKHYSFVRQIYQVNFSNQNLFIRFFWDVLHFTIWEPG